MPSLRWRRALATEEYMEAESTPKPPRKLEYRQPPEGLFRTYTNNVQLATTSFDIRLVFGEVHEVLEDKIVIEQRAQVTMSWVEAKILADFLRANIEAHEHLNGSLKLPKNPDKVIAPDTFLTAK